MAYESVKGHQGFKHNMALKAFQVSILLRCSVSVPPALQVARTPLPGQGFQFISYLQNLIFFFPIIVVLKDKEIKLCKSTVLN